MTIQKITFMGHASLILKTSDKVLAIDPWITGNPACPESLQSFDKLDVIMLTHGHADHAGDAIGLAEKHGATVAATYELGNLLKADGLAEEQVIAMNKGGTVDIDGIKVTLTHAMHSNSYDSKNGTMYAGEACGLVINDGTHSIYAAGDTALFSDMQLIREFYQPELAILPIGDCFTMGPKEAAKAVEYIGCKKVIPVHYGTFPILTGTPEEFQSACSKQDVEVITLEPGTSYNL